MKEEINAHAWKDIPGYEGIYSASTDGLILRTYSDGRKRILKPFLRLRGGDPRNRMALFVCLRRQDGMRVDFPVISLVGRTWQGPPPEGMLAVPLDGNIWNTAAANVLYVTKEQLDKALHGEAAERGNWNGWEIMRISRQRKAVLKKNHNGETVARYASIREAAQANYMSAACIAGRCNGTIQHRWSDDGTTFEWEDMDYEQTHHHRESDA